MSRHGTQSSQCHRGDRLLRTRKEGPNIRSEALAKEEEEEEGGVGCRRERRACQHITWHMDEGYHSIVFSGTIASIVVPGERGHARDPTIGTLHPTSYAKRARDIYGTFRSRARMSVEGGPRPRHACIGNLALTQTHSSMLPLQPGPRLTMMTTVSVPWSAAGRLAPHRLSLVRG